MDQKIVEVYGAAEIEGRLKALAAEISEGSRADELTVLGVTVRTALLRYDHRSRGGAEDLTFSTSIDLTGRDVLLVEGVLDTGVPQEYLMKQLEAQGARRVRLCVLIDKPDGRRTSVT